MGQKRWKYGGIQRRWGWQKEKSLCAPETWWKITEQFFVHNFPAQQVSGGNLFCLNINLNINRARCWDLYQAAVSVCPDTYIYNRICIGICICICGGIMSYCGSRQALAAESDRFTFVYNFHELRFSRSSFHAAFLRSTTLLRSGENPESVSAREMLLLFMYFDKIHRGHSLPDNLVLSTRQVLLPNEDWWLAVAVEWGKCLAEVVMSTQWRTD